jgi:hypothetical protein
MPRESIVTIGSGFKITYSTLAQPAEELGACLARMFLEGLKEPQQIAGRQIKLLPRLVIRESCGATRRPTDGQPLTAHNPTPNTQHPGPNT